jgi:quercetin dioxygenase-like cupin family protein
MKFSNSEKKEVLNSEVAKGYLLAMTDHHDLVELEIMKDGLVPAHALPIDVTFFVISGKGELQIEDQKYNGSKGDVLVVKKNLDREWRNTSDEVLKLLVIKQKV